MDTLNFKVKFPEGKMETIKIDSTKKFSEFKIILSDMCKVPTEAFEILMGYPPEPIKIDENLSLHGNIPNNSVLIIRLSKNTDSPIKSTKTMKKVPSKPTKSKNSITIDNRNISSPTSAPSSNQNTIISPRSNQVKTKISKTGEIIQTIVSPRKIQPFGTVHGTSGSSSSSARSGQMNSSSINRGIHTLSSSSRKKTSSRRITPTASSKDDIAEHLIEAVNGSSNNKRSQTLRQVFRNAITRQYKTTLSTARMNAGIHTLYTIEPIDTIRILGNGEIKQIKIKFKLNINTKQQYEEIIDLIPMIMIKAILIESLQDNEGYGGREILKIENMSFASPRLFWSMIYYYGNNFVQTYMSFFPECTDWTWLDIRKRQLSEKAIINLRQQQEKAQQLATRKLLKQQRKADDSTSQISKKVKLDMKNIVMNSSISNDIINMTNDNDDNDNDGSKNTNPNIHEQSHISTVLLSDSEIYQLIHTVLHDLSFIPLTYILSDDCISEEQLSVLYQLLASVYDESDNNNHSSSSNTHDTNMLNQPMKITTRTTTTTNMTTTSSSNYNSQNSTQSYDSSTTSNSTNRSSSEDIIAAPYSHYSPRNNTTANTTTTTSNSTNRSIVTLANLQYKNEHNLSYILQEFAHVHLSKSNNSLDDKNEESNSPNLVHKNDNNVTLKSLKMTAATTAHLEISDESAVEENMISLFDENLLETYIEQAQYYIIEMLWIYLCGGNSRLKHTLYQQQIHSLSLLSIWKVAPEGLYEMICKTDPLITHCHVYNHQYTLLHYNQNRNEYIHYDNSHITPASFVTDSTSKLNHTTKDKTTKTTKLTKTAKNVTSDKKVTKESRKVTSVHDSTLVPQYIPFDLNYLTNICKLVYAMINHTDELGWMKAYIEVQNHEEDIEECENIVKNTTQYYNLINQYKSTTPTTTTTSTSTSTSTKSPFTTPQIDASKFSTASNRNKRTYDDMAVEDIHTYDNTLYDEISPSIVLNTPIKRLSVTSSNDSGEGREHQDMTEGEEEYEWLYQDTDHPYIGTRVLCNMGSVLSTVPENTAESLNAIYHNITSILKSTSTVRNISTPRTIVTCNSKQIKFLLNRYTTWYEEGTIVGYLPATTEEPVPLWKICLDMSGDNPLDIVLDRLSIDNSLIGNNDHLRDILNSVILETETDKIQSHNNDTLQQQLLSKNITKTSIQSIKDDPATTNTNNNTTTTSNYSLICYKWKPESSLYTHKHLQTQASYKHLCRWEDIEENDVLEGIFIYSTLMYQSIIYE